MAKNHKKRSTWLLGSSSLFNDVASEMITPILPFFISSLGGGGVAVGLLSGCREGLASISKLLGGWLSDREGRRKPLIFLGYFLSVFFRFFLSLVSSWQQILGFVAFERIGKMRDAPRDALVSTYSKHRGESFGILQMMDSMGAVVGTIFVVFLFWKFNLEFSTIILIAAFISIFSLIPLFFVKDSKIKKTKKGLFEGISSFSFEFKYMLFVLSVFTLGNFGIYMFLLLRAREITGSLIYALLLYALFNLVYSGFSIPFGNLSDRIGRKKILILGYFLFVLVSFGFIFVKSLAFLIVLFALYGLVYAINQTSQVAFVSDYSCKMKGTSIGFFYFVTGMVNILGGLIAGVLWNISPSVMFFYTAILGTISIFLMTFVRKVC